MCALLAAAPIGQASAQTAEEQAAFDQWWNRLLEVSRDTPWPEAGMFEWMTVPPDGSTEFGDALLHKLWRADDLWRYQMSTVTPKQTTVEYDVAFNGRQGWKLGPQQLWVLSKNRTENVPGHNLEANLRVASQSLTNFISGGIDVAVRAGYPCRARLAPNLKWSINEETIGKTGSKLLLEASGNFDPQSSVGTVNSVNMWAVSESGRKSEQVSFVSIGHQAAWLPQVSMATEVRLTSGDGDFVQLDRFVSYEPLTRTSIEALVETPEPGREDPVRGMIRPTSTIFYLDDGSFRVERDPTSPDQHQLPPTTPPTTAADRRLRIAGWGIAACFVIGAGLWLRYRKS